MPIRPEMKARYPSNWHWIVCQVRERSGNRCEWCGVANDCYGYWDQSGRFIQVTPLGVKPEVVQYTEAQNRGLRLVRIVLTVAHIHDKRPEACDLNNLAHLCQRCHNQHDAKDRAYGRRRRQDEATGVQFLFQDQADGA